jgi:amino acid permease
MPAEDLLTREEALGGLPARRAQTLLYLIESHSARLMAQSRQATEWFLTEETSKERELEFIEAFALGQEPPLRPTIQDVERYAPRWAHLVPNNPRLRAAVAHLLGQKYAFTAQAVPSLRAALSLDTEPVEQAYQRLYGRPLATIYAPRLSLADRQRWARAAQAHRLEALPPFWIAFSMTLTETVGAGILALPIGLAAIGPVAGVVILVALGVVNQLTIAAIAECVARSGAVRYGTAFFGRLVADNLGGAGSVILSVSLSMLCFVALMAYYIGVSTTLADATHAPAGVWVVLLFLAGLYFLSRRSLGSTVASALAIGAVNIGLIVVLSVLALTHVQWANLSYVGVPLLDARPFDPAILQVIFGVVLLAYFGHMSVGSCGRLVLQRDASARSLIWGSVAAQMAAMVLYCGWVLAVNGAIAPSELVGLSGTALGPLAAEVGPSVHVFGSLFVILAMGMGSLHMSLGLANLVRERLPARSQMVVLLPRRRGRLLFQPRGTAGNGARLGVTYVGLENRQPRLRLDIQLGVHTHQLEVAVAPRWDTTALLDRFPELRGRGLRVELEVLDATRTGVRLRLASPLSLTYEGEWDRIGLAATDVLALGETDQRIVSELIRRGEVALADLAIHTGQDQAVVRTRLSSLVEHGYVSEVQAGAEPRYRVRLAPRRQRQVPPHIWQALAGPDGMPAGGPAGAGLGPRGLEHRVRERVLGERGRLLLSTTPVLVAFLLTEWLLLTGTESFAALLGLAGVLTATVVGGMFPVLMLIASRRKGELVPGVVYRFLGHPLLVAGIYLLFMGNLIVHGLIIWSGSIERASALAVALLALGATIWMVRRGVFAPRAVVELRDDVRAGRPAALAITVNGQPTAAQVRLGYAADEQTFEAATREVARFSLLRHVAVQLPAGPARELKVWTHQLTLDGDSQPLPARLELSCGQETRRLDLSARGGEALVPLTSDACQLQITLAEREPG